MKFNLFKNARGTTLMEVLIGTIVLVIVTLVATAILAATFKSTTKSEILKEVKQNGDYALTVIGRVIINSAELLVNSDGARCEGGMHKLKVKNIDSTETEFALSADGIITQNGLNITSGNVVISNLSFNCTASLVKPEYITVSFNVQQRGPVLSTEQRASLDFESTFAVRN